MPQHCVVCLHFHLSSLNICLKHALTECSACLWHTLSLYNSPQWLLSYTEQLYLSDFHPLQLLNEKQKLQAMKKHLNISSSDQDDLIYKSELSSVNVTTPPTPSSSSSSSSAFQVASLGKPLPLQSNILTNTTDYAICSHRF